jgi:opacity protein-like surface antigen
MPLNPGFTIILYNMRKIFLTAALYLFPIVLLTAQKLHLGVFGGFSNYQGDLQTAKFTLSQAKFAFGAGATYEVSEKINVRLNYVTGKVSGNDKSSETNAKRNLSFSSPITELHLGVEYDLFNVYEKGYSIYLFAGIGGFKFNPSTIDSLGKKVYLQPLGTEGQGFYQGRKKYSLNSLVIPFGGGLKLPVNDDVFIRLEAGVRKTFTDYLDDVSTTYANRADLLANNGPKAVELSFRGDELTPPLAYPSEGAIRGSPKRTDYYYIVGASISFRLSPKNDGGGKSKTACPVNVY